MLDFSGGHLENDLENIEAKMLPMPVQKLAKGNSETIFGGDLIIVYPSIPSELFDLPSFSSVW